LNFGKVYEFGTRFIFASISPFSPSLFVISFGGENTITAAKERLT
jgi:hypothetical protein